MRTENSNKPHGFGAINPDNFTPFPKNPVIGRFFRQIGWADELGSGMRKLMKYGKAYGGVDPEMVEDDVFRIIVKVPEFSIGGKPQVVDQAPVTPPVTPPVSEYIVRLLLLLDQKGPQGNADIRETFQLKDRRRMRETYITPALADGLIEMTIPDKPNSRLQKYRLTEKGRQVLKERTGKHPK